MSFYRFFVFVIWNGNEFLHFNGWAAAYRVSTNCYMLIINDKPLKIQIFEIVFMAIFFFLLFIELKALCYFGTQPSSTAYRYTETVDSINELISVDIHSILNVYLFSVSDNVFICCFFFLLSLFRWLHSLINTLEILSTLSLYLRYL